MDDVPLIGGINNINNKYLGKIIVLIKKLIISPQLFCIIIKKV